MKIVITENQSKRIMNKLIYENTQKLKILDVDTMKFIGKPGVGTHNAPDWASRNAWDIVAKEGTYVYSIVSGRVVSVLKRGKEIVKRKNKRLYGDQVKIESEDKSILIFYTHISSFVSPNDKVYAGQAIGQIIEAPGMTGHLHIGLSHGTLDEFINKATADFESNQCNC